MADIKILSGQCYLVKKIGAQCAESYRRKLLAMGFIPGAKVQVKRVAPLGGPVQFEINGSSLSVRWKELTECLCLELLDE